MAKSDVENPLLANFKDDQPVRHNNALKNRNYRRSKSVPTKDLYNSQQQCPTSFHHQDSIFSNKLDFKKVVLFLTAYLVIGTFCFYHVRHQMKGKKTNGVLDAIYFCIVTMTTVGYGDLVPDSVMSKLFACVFVFVGMGIVGFLLSKAADFIVEKQEVLFVKAIHMRDKCSHVEILREVECNKVQYRFFTCLVVLVLLVIVGMLVLCKNEGLEVFDAFYCVCATITTLGYGDKSFSTAGGRLFAAIWIATSTICLAQFYYSLAELYTERRRRLLVNWVLTRKLTVSDLEAADLDDDKVVSAAEFALYKLKEMGKINEEDIAVVMEGFRNLDVDHSGTLTNADLVNPESSS